MSLIHIGMDTDKFEKDFFVLHCTRLQERIAELEKANTLAVCSLKVGGKMNQILTAKVAELEKELATSTPPPNLVWFERSDVLGLDPQQTGQIDLRKFALKQQAKSLREYSEYLISDAEGIPEGLEHKGRGSSIYNWQAHFARELRYRANNLSNAKEALKEQVNE
tara:strand:+ start:456 stop:950 length:495 start_codon:yes stop_codon:yes gene_type:complete